MLTHAADENGREILYMGDEQAPYTGDNRIVMMEWEKPYMERLVEAAMITRESDVLEIGYGLGYSAAAIQRQRPASHTIIECDATVLVSLKRWALLQEEERGQKVIVVEGFWQQQLPGLADSSFSVAFFDDFPLSYKEEQQMSSSSSSTDAQSPGATRWRDFVTACVPKLRQEGRITGYMATPLDASLRSIPRIEVTQLQPFAVSPSDNCGYYPWSHACVPILKVLAKPDGHSSGEGGRGGKRNAAEAPEDPARRQRRKLLHALVVEKLMGKGEEVLFEATAPS